MKQALDSYSFGLYSPRRGENFKEGVNPFTGEVNRFYEHKATDEETNSFFTAIDNWRLAFDEEANGYSGSIAGTEIFMPDICPDDPYLSGAVLELIGDPTVADESLAFALELASKGRMYFAENCGELPLAVTDDETMTLVKAIRDEELIIVDTVEALRSWLHSCVGVQKVSPTKSTENPFH